MENEFNDHEKARADIEEALVEAFEAQSLLKKLGNASPDLHKLAKRIDRVCFLLDRPWPHKDGAAQPSGNIADAVREVFADSPFGRVTPH